MFVKDLKKNDRFTEKEFGDEVFKCLENAHEETRQDRDGNLVEVVEDEYFKKGFEVRVRSEKTNQGRCFYQHNTITWLGPDINLIYK